LGLKENIDAVKEEISTEEQFLESIIKGERFFKKYKKLIIAIVSLAFFGLVAYGVISYINKQKIEASNNAYKVLLSNPQDSEALNNLKTNNIRLYNLFVFSQAIQNDDKVALKELSAQKDDVIISDLAQYQLAGLEGQKEAKSDILRGMALLQEGYTLMVDGKVSEAKLKFAQIDLSSPVKNIANSLEHYHGK
jgi:hypothetical protein